MLHESYSTIFKQAQWGDCLAGYLTRCRLILEVRLELLLRCLHSEESASAAHAEGVMSAQGTRPIFRGQLFLLAKGQLDGRLQSKDVQSPKIAFESKLTLTGCFSLALSIKIHQTVPSHLAMTWNKNFELLTFSGMTGLQPPFLQTFNPHRCGLGNPTCLLPPIPTLPSRC